MARDKTDKTDKTAARTYERWENETWQELLSTLEGFAREYLAEESGEMAVPGWHVLWPLGPYIREVDGIEILTLTEEKAKELVKRAETDAHAFDAAGYLASFQFAVAHLTQETDWPKSLCAFGVRVLAGDLKRPPQRGRPRAPDVLIRFRMYRLCSLTAKYTSLPLSRNRQDTGQGGFSVCDAVAEAFTRAGHHVTHMQLASLCYDAAHADLRALVDAPPLPQIRDGQERAP